MITMRAASLLFVLAGCTPTEIVDHAVVGGALLAVRIEVDAGDVTVEAGGTSVQVGRTLRGAAGRTVTQRVENGILRIEARCESLLPCGADIALTVPAGLPVDVSPEVIAPAIANAFAVLEPVPEPGTKAQQGPGSLPPLRAPWDQVAWAREASWINSSL
jgi:hypothetical protein